MIQESFSNATSSSNSSDADFTSSIPTKMLPLLQMGPGQIKSWKLNCNLCLKLGLSSTGSLAIAEAASNAIAATQLLTGGRRTSSLKASFQAINLGMQNNEFKLSKDVALVSPVSHFLGFSTFKTSETFLSYISKKWLLFYSGKSRILMPFIYLQKFHINV